MSRAGSGSVVIAGATRRGTLISAIVVTGAWLGLTVRTVGSAPAGSWRHTQPSGPHGWEAGCSGWGAGSEAQQS